MRKNRLVSCIAALALAVLSLAGCQSAAPQPSSETYTFTDSLGNTVTLHGHPQKVAALMGSYAETWLLAGGELAGVTEDAYSERGLDLPEDTVQLGRVHEPDLEALLAMEPDLVLLSADQEGHAKLAGTLQAAGIPAAYFRVDTFSDYLAMLKLCTELTGREDLYAQNGAQVEADIRQTLDAVAGKPAPRVLYLRAYTTGVRAKGADTVAGAMLKDLGAVNIADEDGNSLMENLQLESILAADPDFILITTMGADSEKALETVRATLEDNPAWGTLSAVREGRYRILPKEVFHYKPNARWGESYAMLAEILYGAG
ncbi:MAG: ABC transporter substrate-binding protein [Christensenellales bacterium]